MANSTQSISSNILSALRALPAISQREPRDSSGSLTLALQSAGACKVPPTPSSLKRHWNV